MLKEGFQLDLEDSIAHENDIDDDDNYEDDQFDQATYRQSSTDRVSVAEVASVAAEQQQPFAVEEQPVMAYLDNNQAEDKSAALRNKSCEDQDQQDNTSSSKQQKSIQNNSKIILSVSPLNHQKLGKNHHNASSPQPNDKLNQAENKKNNNI